MKQENLYTIEILTGDEPGWWEIILKDAAGTIVHAAQYSSVPFGLGEVAGRLAQLTQPR